MIIREVLRPLPGVRRVSLLRQRLAYSDSARFWERNYARGATSGSGSYGALAEGKSRFLNTLVREQAVRSVIEFGCGDGNQLSLADYPRYVGLDVSRSAIAQCQRRFAATVSQSASAAGAVDQNPAHHLCCGGKEMPAAVPFLILVGHQSQPCFVNECRRLKSLPGCFMGHLGRRQFA